MMIPGDGMTTEELFAQARQRLAALEKLMSARRNRDRACMTLTDLHVSIEGLARRLAGVEFTAPPVSHDEEDEPRPEMAELSLADLMAAAPDDLERAAADEQGADVRELRLHYFRLYLDYQLAGCTTLGAVVRKVLAFVRRFRPQAMQQLGLSQSDVARLLGESRAKVHAREKRLVERALQSTGAKGYLGLGGQRGEQARANCRAAQKGNQNRRRGEAKKRDEAA
jgi:hypothetical protein